MVLVICPQLCREPAALCTAALSDSQCFAAGTEADEEDLVPEDFGKGEDEDDNGVESDG